MSDYDWIEITAPGDYNQLIDKLDSEFQPAEIAEQFQQSLSNNGPAS